MKLFTVCMKLANSNGFSTSDVTGEYTFLKKYLLDCHYQKRVCNKSSPASKF